MSDDSLNIRGKYTVKCKGKKVVLTKNINESRFHVLAKAIVYATYCDQYDPLVIEPKPFGRFRPDVIGYDEDQTPNFWAECGKVSPEKIKWMTKKYRKVHFVFVKKSHQCHTFKSILKKSVDPKFQGLIEMIGFPQKILDDTEHLYTIDLNDLDLDIQTIYSH